MQLYHVQKARQEFKRIECSVNRRSIIRYRANGTNKPSLDYKYEITIEVFCVNELSQGTGELDEMMRSTLHIALILPTKRLTIWIKRRVIFLMLPEVVGSNPTRSIFYCYRNTALNRTWFSVL